MNKTFEKLLTQSNLDGEVYIIVDNPETGETCKLYTQTIIDEGVLKLQVFDLETGEFYGMLLPDELILKQLSNS